MSKILIAGVGNLYRRDDGVGIAVIEAMRSKKTSSPGVSIGDLDFFDAGTDGFSLFDKLSLYEKTIIIDAVHMGEAPGEVRAFSPEEAKLKIKSDALSTHGFGLAEVLKLVEQFEVKSDIKIIGVEPENIDFGEGLSDVVKNKIPVILDLIFSVIARTE